MVKATAPQALPTMPQAIHVAPANETADGPDVARQTAAQVRRDRLRDERKHAFLRVVSHELRTQLNAIMGFSEIIASEVHGPLGAPQYKEYLEIIRSSGQRLLRLVNQVLEIARLEGGVMDLHMKPEALDVAIDETLDRLKDEVAQRHIRVVVADHGRLPLVVADPRGLRTMLTNLIQNAVQFSPEGSTVRIAALRCSGSIEICVIDEGPGVPAADIPRLLRPFEQGEHALIRTTQGAGLGLPITDLLARAMNGRLRLEPAPTGGLCARVRLAEAEVAKAALRA